MFWLIVLAVLAVVAYLYLTPKYSDNDTSTQQVHETILPTLPESDEEEDGSATDPAAARAYISGAVESLDWLNDITKICWPHLCHIVEKELGPTVEPLVNAALPKPLKNFQFVKTHLGKDHVSVDRVTVHKRYKDAVALDLDVNFSGKPDISMKVSPLGSTFGVEEIRWFGRLSVLMRPLTTTLPCIGAVQASFITHPTLEIDFTGAASFADIGPVERIIRKVVRDVLASMLVLPNHFLYKLNDSIDFFDVYYPPVGALLVSVVRGRGFEKEKKAKFVKLTPDCYTKLKFGLKKVETPVVKKSLTPEWNFSHMFVLSDMEQPLELKTMDQDPVQDDILGEVTILARDLVKEKERWVAFERNVDATVAANAQILVRSEMLVFGSNYNGACMVSVLLDRVFGLPRGTRSALCRLKIGNCEQKDTIAITKPAEPIPGVDPENPVFSFSHDVIVPSIGEGNVSISVIADKESAGEVNFSVAELASGKNSTEGLFKLNNNATIRAKVILRGLQPVLADRNSAQ